MKTTVKRRTFEAAKYPPQSAERQRLNEKALTSEYMTSYRYIVIDENGEQVRTFRTRAEAEAFNNG